MKLNLCLATVAFAALAPALQAQEEGPEARAFVRDEIPKILDAYLLSNLQERLGLSDDEHKKLLPLVMQYQSDTHKYRRKRMKGVSELKKLLGSGAATEAQVGEQLKEVRECERDLREKMKKGLEAIDNELTVVQQAKFRVLEHEVERRFFQLMKQHMSAGGGRRADRPERPTRNKENDKKEKAEGAAKP